MQFLGSKYSKNAFGVGPKLLLAVCTALAIGAFFIACSGASLLAKEPRSSSASGSQKFSTLPAKKEIHTVPLPNAKQEKTKNQTQKDTSAYKQILKEVLNKNAFPKQSSVQQSPPQQNSSQQNTKPQPQIDFRKQTQVVLGDGRSVSGSIKLKVPPQIRIEHSKDGINYYKDIRMEDINFIELKAWKGRFLKRKSQGEVYRFEVSRYVLHLNSGQALIHRGEILPFLREFSLSNENGKVRLYSYWLDLYTKEGTWHTGMQGAFGKERVLCHAAVVKKISFIQE